jgi:hypothetical protein
MPKKKPLNSGNPKAKAMAILSESNGDIRSVQRLTAGAERFRSGYRIGGKHGGTYCTGSMEGIV